MGDMVNIFIDDLQSLLWRLYDLPLYFIFALLVLTLIVFAILFRVLIKRAWTPKPKVLIGFVLVFLMLACLMVLDNKFKRLSDELNLLNDKYYSVLNSIRFEHKSDSSQVQSLLCKPENLESLPDIYEVRKQSVNEATDLFFIRRNDPLGVIYIAVVDLRDPRLQVVLTPDIKEKRFTSAIAQQNDCFIAINGEAGESAGKAAPLGRWTGNYIVNGNPLLLADTKDRPFLSFDRNNRAKYYSSTLVDTSVTPDKYNAIWGRFDILIEGEIKVDRSLLKSNGERYARTIMGINREGTILYLMIVDGRQPNWSYGLRLDYCAKILRLLGAWDAMACDQGGSSCMYLKGRGIINRPADGAERPTYTHFGLRLKQK